MKSFFKVDVNKYVLGKDFSVVRPASLDNPKDNAVMFLSNRFIQKVAALSKSFEKVNECLIFWPEGAEIPETVVHKHAVVICKNPHNCFSRFFSENNIKNQPKPNEYNIINGAYIEVGANISRGCVIFPGAYIAKNVFIGENSYIGAGVKIMGDVQIGKNVVIRENTVIGADGLTTDRDEMGRALTIPQFGGVQIGDDVQIGANTVIARGAIDDTIISQGVKIDSSSFISHNVYIGKDTFVVGEVIMFGNSSVGERTLISGNSLISNRVHIGSNVLLGASSTATKDIPDGTVAYGAPAKVIRNK